MSNKLNFFRIFHGIENEFRPYYEKENNLYRLIIIHSFAAFIITPIFSYIIHQTDVPQVYFYLGLSYTILLPVYILLCWFIPFLRDKLIYFFIAHLFGMTIVAFNSLLENQFDLTELFCFYGLYAVSVVVIQRWYPALLYNIFIFTLIFYGLETVNDIEVSKGLIYALFIVLILSSTVVLYSRQRMVNSVEDHAEYLKRIMNNPGTGYVLFDFLRSKKIIDFNTEAARLLNAKEDHSEEVMKQLFHFFNTEDQEQIKKLKLGRKYIKTINYTMYNRQVYVELSVNILSLKNGFYWLCRVTDVTDEISKREELELNERKYRNLYYRNKAGVFTIDQKAKIVNGNDAFFEMFEGTVRMGDYLFSLEQSDEWTFILESLGTKESIQNYQTQFTLTNGSQKSFIFSWYVDSLTNAIEGSVIDLTTIQKASQALRQSEQKYRLIFEESNDVILLLEDDKITDVNRRAIQLFGRPERELIGTKLFDLSVDLTEESKKRYDQNYEQLSNIRSTKFEWEFNGNSRVVEAEVSLIEIILGNKLYYQCVIHDNTEKNINLRKIEQNRRNLENILENNPEGILILREKEVLYRNSEIDSILGKKVNIDKLFIKEDQQRFNQLYSLQLDSGLRQNLQLELIGKSKEQIPVDVTLVTTNFEDGPATLMIIKDISVQNTLAKEKLRAELAEETNKKLADEIMERIRAEKLLQEQYLRTKAILDSSSNTFLLILDHHQKIASFNTHFESYIQTLFKTELKTGEKFNIVFSDVFTPLQLRFFRRKFTSVKTGNSLQFEVEMKKGNEVIWWEIFMNPIFDTEGFIAEISLVAHDITEKKKTDNEIVESLKEKEILLKEIHHRVKNNLQVISSILNLQSSFVQDENTLGILHESRNRIRSMAIIHENLYRTKDFSSINFANYLQNLTANLIASYRINEEVVLDADLQEIDLVLDQAIPCGLLMNELITNALKYAWKSGEKGTITLRLKEENNIVELTVADDGVGLPTAFEDMNSDTLGLQLVVTLIEQLEGELKVDSENGTKYLIKFENIKPKVKLDVKN